MAATIKHLNDNAIQEFSGMNDHYNCFELPIDIEDETSKVVASTKQNTNSTKKDNTD